MMFKGCYLGIKLVADYESAIHTLGASKVFNQILAVCSTARYKYRYVDFVHAFFLVAKLRKKAESALLSAFLFIKIVHFIRDVQSNQRDLQEACR